MKFQVDLPVKINDTNYFYILNKVLNIVDNRNTLVNGWAICLRNRFEMWTASSMLKFKTESLRCSWIHLGSFLILSALENR